MADRFMICPRKGPADGKIIGVKCVDCEHRDFVHDSGGCQMCRMHDLADRIEHVVASAGDPELDL